MGMVELKDWVRSKGAKSTLFAILFFAVITFAVFWGYLLGGNAIVGSDGMGPPADLAMMQKDSSYFSSWRSFPALGHINYPSPTLSAVYIIFMDLFGLGPVATTQIILVSSFWIAGFAMYLCARQILGSHSAGLVAGLAYLFNQVFLSQVTEAHHYFLIGCAVFPLLFLFLYRAVNDLDRRSGVALPIMAYIFGTVAAPNLVMIASVFIFLFLLAYILTARDWSWVRRGYTAVVGGICVGLVLLPTVLMKYAAGGTPVLATYYPIEQARLYSSYTLYHSFVMASSENTFIFGSDIGQWTIISSLWIVGLIIAVVVPLTALLSTLVKERRQLVISFLLPMAIFIVLATGTNPPFGDLFTYLYKNVPLMDSLRVYSRFHLMTGFAMAMLLGVTYRHADVISERLSRLKGRKGKFLHYFFTDRRRLAVVLGFCLIFPSSTILAGEVRSFDVPSSYLEPYEWVADQNGEFRVLNLPYQNVFYKDDLAHYDGYPSTMTMDVGMYSPTFSTTPYAFGLETNSYWTFFGAVLDQKQFGYKDISGLLGGSASVRYVVAQNYADPEEIGLFASLNNMTLVRSFDGGGEIYLNEEYQERVHGLGSISLASGDRSVIPLILGTGLVDPATDGIVLIGQVDDHSALSDLMDRASTIVVPNGDLLQMVSEVFPWDESSITEFASYGDKHSQDPSRGWISTNAEVYAGLTSLPTILTTSDRALTVPVSVQGSGEYDLLVRAISSPDAGRLSVSIDGTTVLDTVPWALSERAEWIRLQNLSLSSGPHQLTVANDGTGSMNLEQAVLVPHGAVEERLDRLSGLLDQYQDKVVYLYSASQASQWVASTYFEWAGAEGQGVAGSLQLPVGNTVSLDDRVYDPAAHDRLAAHIGPNGAVLRPDLGNLAQGVTYSANLSLSYQGEPSTEAVATVVVQGRNASGGTVVIGTAVLERNSSATGYSGYGFDIEVPLGVRQLEFNVTPASGVIDLRADLLSIGPQDSEGSQINIEVPVDGDYIISVRGENATSDAFVSIDGIRYSLLGTGDGLSTSAINISTGQHLMEIGVPDIYSVELATASSAQNPMSSAVEYERVSSTEYMAHVSTDSAGWVLLAESYNALWVAEMDGQELDHVQVNGMVNAYYIPSAGDHTITFTFHGQEIYEGILLGLFLATAVSVVALILLQLPRVGRSVLRPRRDRSPSLPLWRRVRWRGGK